MKRHFLLALALTLGGCKKDLPPSPSKPVIVDAAPPAVLGPPVPAKRQETKPGADLKIYFPGDGVLGTKRTFTQEKLGFAEAKVQQGGKDLAVLSITDALNDADAKGKFANTAEKLDDAPVISIGKTQSAALVKGRYVLTVDSQILDDQRRKTWLTHFNVKALSAP